MPTSRMVPGGECGPDAYRGLSGASVGYSSQDPGCRRLVTPQSVNGKLRLSEVNLGHPGTFPRKLFPRRGGPPPSHRRLPQTAVHQQSFRRQLRRLGSSIGRMPYSGTGLVAEAPARCESGRWTRSPAPTLTPPPHLPAPPASLPSRGPRRPGGRARRRGLPPTGSCACRRGRVRRRSGHRVRRRR